MKICNGLFTFLDPRYVDLYALEEDVLQRIVEDISRCYLIFHSSLKYLDMILSSFGDMILTRDSIINLKTIVDHCPQNFENHRKTIGSNGWTPKKTFNGDGPTLSKQLNYPVVTITILIWLCCSKVYCQSSLIFIAAHCSYKPNQNHC